MEQVLNVTKGTCRGPLRSQISISDYRQHYQNPSDLRKPAITVQKSYRKLASASKGEYRSVGFGNIRASLVVDGDSEALEPWLSGGAVRCIAQHVCRQYQLRRPSFRT